MEQSVRLTADGYIGLLIPKSLAFSQKWKQGRDLVYNPINSIRDVSKAFKDVKLEQLILILDLDKVSNHYSSTSYYTKETYLIEKDLMKKTDTIIINGNSEDLEIFKTMNKSQKNLGNISNTTRGVPLQNKLTKKNSKFEAIRGVHVNKFTIDRTDEYLPNHLVTDNEKFDKLRRQKIVSQRLVAHVENPREHLLIKSAYDENGIISVDTVENTYITDPKFSYEFVVCLLNSKLISWYCYHFVYSDAVRSMDLDEYYINKIPLPNSLIDNGFFKDRLSQIKNALQKNNTNKIAEIEKELDKKIYALYGLNQRQIHRIEKISE
jgi:hypothetical protein